MLEGSFQTFLRLSIKFGTKGKLKLIAQRLELFFLIGRNDLINRVKSIWKIFIDVRH